jgi:putative transposase
MATAGLSVGPGEGEPGLDATRTRPAYDTDLTDAQGALFEPLLPAAVPAGAPRATDLREGVNALFYRLHNGCAWKHLPQDFPPEGTVRDYFHRCRRQGLWEQLNDTLRRQLRQAEGKEPEPTAASIDSPSVKATRTSGLRGYDAGKKVKGTKRHIVVDTVGLLWCVVVPAADIQDRDGAQLVFARARPKFATLRLVWADGGYAGKLSAWLQALCGWVRTIVKRSDGVQGWVLLPRRWVVERTFAWLSHCRVWARDYEYHAESSEAWFQLGMIQLMLRRLQPGKPQQGHRSRLANCRGV